MKKIVITKHLPNKEASRHKERLEENKAAAAKLDEAGKLRAAVERRRILRPTCGTEEESGSDWEWPADGLSSVATDDSAGEAMDVDG